MGRTFFLYLAAFLFGLTMWHTPAPHPDLGWHLAGGKYVYTHLTDHFSMATLLSGSYVPRADFINTFRVEWHDSSWTWQVLLYQVYLWGGYTLLHSLLALLTAIALLLLMKSIVRGLHPTASHALPLLLFLLLASLLLTELHLRPQLPCIILLLISQEILLRHPSRKEIPLLFATTACAANLHPYWAFIPLLWLLYRSLPAFINAPNAQTRGYGWGGLSALLLAPLCSPYGLLQGNLGNSFFLANYASVLDHLLTPASLAGHVGEFRSSIASAFGSPAILFLPLLAFWLRRLRFSYMRESLGREVAFVVTAILAVYDLGFLDLFAVLALPGLCSRLRDFPEPTGHLPRALLATASRYLPPLMAGILAVNFGFSARERYRAIPEELTRAFPLKLCRDLAYLPDGTGGAQSHLRILTNFYYGGWCRWAAYEVEPSRDIRVTSDSRTGNSLPVLVARNEQILGLAPKWRHYLNLWHPDLIIVDYYSPLRQAMPFLSGEWEVLAHHEQFAILSRKGGKR